MIYQLPPVGNPVTLTADLDSMPPSFMASVQTRFYSSGTAALAATIKAVIAYKGLSETNMAEVILPVYACPDLVSAVIYAGAQPVLVDIECDRPWLDLSLLAESVTKNTVAIVAVNLFGLSERWLQLRELAEQNNLYLIEDSAQYFPGAEEAVRWHGDLVVFSFGRGKPVSLLGGGAVTCVDSALFEFLPAVEQECMSWKDKISFKLKVWLYNAMISPSLYWLPQSLPFLHLGETRYHSLDDIKAMDEVRLKLLANNIARYQTDIGVVKRCEKISGMLEAFDNVVDLPRACENSPRRRLLRYPILLDADERDRVYQKLKKSGLGPSTMYPASLPKISGLSDLLDSERCFPHAENFAERILTLPIHSQVKEKNIDLMGIILKDNL